MLLNKSKIKLTYLFTQQRRGFFSRSFILNVKTRQQTLYQVLQLKSTQATQQDIKKQYYKVARKFHPDLHPNDQKALQRFKTIQKAYEVLGRPFSRQAYDIQKGFNQGARSRDGSSIYTAARYSKGKMSYRLKRRSDPYFNKYTGFKKPKWYNAFNGYDQRAQYTYFGNVIDNLGVGPPKIVRVMEAIQKSRLWIYIAVIAAYQIYLSTVVKYIEAKGERLKSQIRDQIKQQQGFTATQIDGEEEENEEVFQIDINNDQKKDIMNAYIEFRRAKLSKTQN